MGEKSILSSSIIIHDKYLNGFVIKQKRMLHTRLDIDTQKHTFRTLVYKKSKVNILHIYFCFPSQTVIHYLPIFKRKVKLNSFYRILVNHDANFYLNFYYLALDAKKKLAIVSLFKCWQ